MSCVAAVRYSRSGLLLRAIVVVDVEVRLDAISLGSAGAQMALLPTLIGNVRLNADHADRTGCAPCLPPINIKCCPMCARWIRAPGIASREPLHMQNSV